MKWRLVFAGVLTFWSATMALADEYYVTRDPSSNLCTVSTTKPESGKEIVTQIGPIGFKSRDEAESRINQTPACSTSSSSSSSGSSSASGSSSSSSSSSGAK